MAIQRAFINLLSDDIERASAFYVELLGYRETFRSEWFIHLAAPEGGALELGFLRRDCAVVPQHARARPVGGLLTVVVDDVASVHRRAQQLGVRVLEEPRDLFYGQRRLLLEGPDGEVLDVSSECAPDPEWLERVQEVDGRYVERP